MRAHERNIRRLRQRIPEEAVGQLIEPANKVAVLVYHPILQRFRLRCGIMPQLVHMGKQPVYLGEFRNLRDHRLHAKRRDLRINPHGEIVHRHVINRLLQHFRLVPVRSERLDIGDQQEGLIFVLELHPVH